MPLDVQARGPAEQCCSTGVWSGRTNRRVTLGRVSPRFGNAPPQQCPPATDCRVNAKTRGVSRIISTADRRRGVLRHPVAFAIGLIALLAATPAAYFYRISLLGLCRSFRSDRRRLYCGAPVRDCSRSIGPSHRRYRLRGAVDQIERAKKPHQVEGACQGRAFDRGRQAGVRLCQEPAPGPNRGALSRAPQER